MRKLGSGLRVFSKSMRHSCMCDTCTDIHVLAISDDANFIKNDLYVISRKARVIFVSLVVEFK